MDSLSNIFLLTIQPNIDKTIKDIGTIQTNVNLTEDMTAGVLLMAENIWGSKYLQHITLQLYNTNISVTKHPIFLYQQEQVNLNQPMFLYTADDYKKKYLIIKVNDIIEYTNQSWDDYIQKISSIPTNNIRIPNEITMQYTCRLINYQSRTMMICQFPTTNFIIGMLDLLSWLNISEPYFDITKPQMLVDISYINRIKHKKLYFDNIRLGGSLI